MKGPPMDLRQARQALLNCAEPGDSRLAALVQTHGPLEAVGRLWAACGSASDSKYSLRLRAADLDREADRAAAVGARLVCPEDGEWPGALLGGLGDVAGSVVPHALWVRGHLDLGQAVNRAVAVVGSRASTAYGEHTATELASGLSDLGWTVVSGAAYGIDGAAHRAALAVGGTTIAVLAGGVDDAYPKGHEALLARIIDNGLVVSELPLLQHPTRSRFLERNRIIAALGRGTVAVEMARRSGAANTLGFAVRLLRPVMAVPGPVGSAMSAGCHDWIRDRQAELVCDAGDVARLLSPVGEVDEPMRRGAERPTDRLSSAALQVFEVLPPVGLFPLAQLEAATALPLAVLGDTLRELLAAGLVEVVDHSVLRSRATRRAGP